MSDEYINYVLIKQTQDGKLSIVSQEESLGMIDNLADEMAVNNPDCYFHVMESIGTFSMLIEEDE